MTKKYLQTLIIAILVTTLLAGVYLKKRHSHKFDAHEISLAEKHTTSKQKPENRNTPEQVGSAFTLVSPNKKSHSFRGLCAGKNDKSDFFLMSRETFLHLRINQPKKLILPAFQAECFLSVEDLKFQVVNFDSASDLPYDSFGSFHARFDPPQRFASMDEFILSRHAANLSEVGFKNTESLRAFFKMQGGSPAEEVLVFPVLSLGKMDYRARSDKNSFYPGVQFFHINDLTRKRGEIQIIDMTDSQKAIPEDLKQIKWRPSSLVKIPVVRPSFFLDSNKPYIVPNLDPRKTTVLVGEDLFDAAPYNAVAILRQQGFTDISILKNGLRSFQKLDLQTPTVFPNLTTVNQKNLDGLLKEKFLVIDTRSKKLLRHLLWRDAWTAPIDYSSRGYSFLRKLANYSKAPDALEENLGLNRIDVEAIAEKAKDNKILLVGENALDWGPLLLALKLKTKSLNNLHWLRGGFEQLAYLNQVDPDLNVYFEKFDNQNSAKSSTSTSLNQPSASTMEMIQVLKKSNTRSFLKKQDRPSSP